MKIDLKKRGSCEILECFKSLHVESGEIVEFEFFDSDIESFGYKAFVDLAQLFFMKMLTPLKEDETTTLLRFQKLYLENSFHKTDKSSEKYGVESEFFTIDKTKQFSFLYHYTHTLDFIDVKSKKRILNLGVNRGDEFKIIKEMLTCEEFASIEFVGIDYCASAIEYAKSDFSHDKNVQFLCHDINKLEELNLGKFDLIISIGTLQSSNINFNAAFMSIYQNHLESGGAMILGFPNCRWMDGEMIYGAKAPNYSFSELSLVLKDIHFCKKYLQQKKYRVVITGKDYLFLSARKII
ncbi:MAG: methyltransferase [Sulfurimonas sp. RIFOXYD12_FULL_36_11]|uniref:class I SAM-dependent methyltransferase n=1 Tax=Sulfurimonas sp. RIFOXYB12_FULL_35_9 TaxID=1802256 RepID=UPI0008C86B29|nr:class I SAM-dependent methyltransferase [Sulfurimonas sp. RIFOXYB12_FULL_35_9]OHE05003.1 MAG: methyltransferase [Sulfurimonas sp. RIFOXYB12_FULL_35_9]OHE11998.1 MAG: methyltransferase [Sulfurimonas sp. RIFOXYD12_FULL_36_11]